MRLTKEDMIKLMKHRDGTKLISITELNILELNEEYDKLEALYSKAEIMNDFNTIASSENWTTKNIGNGSNLDDILNQIDESKKKINNLIIDDRNNKIDNIIDTHEDN